jgi:hypothetical protein
MSAVKDCSRGPHNVYHRDMQCPLAILYCYPIDNLLYDGGMSCVRKKLRATPGRSGHVHISLLSELSLPYDFSGASRYHGQQESCRDQFIDPSLLFDHFISVHIHDSSL